MNRYPDTDGEPVICELFEDLQTDRCGQFGAPVFLGIGQPHQSCLPQCAVHVARKPVLPLQFGQVRGLLFADASGHIQQRSDLRRGNLPVDESSAPAHQDTMTRSRGQ